MLQMGYAAPWAHLGPSLEAGKSLTIAQPRHTDRVVGTRDFRQISGLPTWGWVLNHKSSRCRDAGWCAPWPWVQSEHPSGQHQSTYCNADCTRPDTLGEPSTSHSSCSGPRERQCVPAAWVSHRPATLLARQRGLGAISHFLQNPA